MTPEDINEAVKLVRQEIGTGVSFAEAVASAAREFELNPALVERKFRERFSLSPEQLAALGPEKIQTKEGLLKAAIDALVKEHGAHPRCGRRFVVHGKEYVFVTVDRTARFPIVSVDVETLESCLCGWAWAASFLDEPEVALMRLSTSELHIHMQKLSQGPLSPEELTALREVQSGSETTIFYAHYKTLIEMCLVQYSVMGRMRITDFGVKRLAAEDAKGNG